MVSIVVGAALLVSASMYKTASMDKDAIGLAFASCKSEALKLYPTTDNFFFTDARSFVVIEGCMANHGFGVYMACNSLSAPASNVNCYYRPQTSSWDFILHHDLTLEIDEWSRKVPKP
jgi:hypothetical protein